MLNPAAFRVALTEADAAAAEEAAIIPFWDLVDPVAPANIDGQAGYRYEGELIAKNPWDVVRLGGHWLPGLCKVKGSAKKQLDVQKASGIDGGVLIERGYVPGELDIEVVMWTPEQWRQWQRIMRSIYRRPNRLDVTDSKAKGVSAAQVAVIQKAALPISNPRSAMLGIEAVVITSITMPDDGPIAGSMQVTIKCTEYVTPSSKVATRRVSNTYDPNKVQYGVTGNAVEGVVSDQNPKTPDADYRAAEGDDVEPEGE